MSNKNIGQKRKLEHWEVVTLLLMLYDFLAIGLSYFAALWVRFDCRYNSIQKEFLSAYYRTIVIYAVFCVVVFWFLRLYKSIWRFASYAELLRIILATAITGAVYMIAMFEFVYRMPISYFVFGIVFQFCLTLGIRFAYRFILLLRGRRREEAGYKKRVMLVGAGAAGQMIFRDIKQSKETNEKVYCFIDDNSNKWGRYIDDVPVFGGRENIMEAVAKFGIEKIYVAIPSADAKERREIKVDLTEYKFTTPFIDIAEQIGDQITYKTNGDLEVKVKIDAAKEKKAEDLLLMLVDPETGKVVFITIDEIDPVTGELKVTLPFLGAITLLDKSAVDENEIETQTTDAGAADTETAAE